MAVKFQSTPPSRGATKSKRPARSGPAISIHAPLAGGDAKNIRPNILSSISIHAPLAGGDLMQQLYNMGYQQFQSTPPSRGATKRVTMSAPPR